MLDDVIYVSDGDDDDVIHVDDGSDDDLIYVSDDSDEQGMTIHLYLIICVR